jgi:hypothetical protein
MKPPWMPTTEEGPLQRLRKDAVKRKKPNGIPCPLCKGRGLASKTYRIGSGAYVFTAMSSIPAKSPSARATCSMCNGSGFIAMDKKEPAPSTDEKVNYSALVDSWKKDIEMGRSRKEMEKRAKRG